MKSGFRNYLLGVTKASDCKEVEVIQSLWSDYGKISRYELVGSPHDTVVVKHISLGRRKDHPRGWNTDNSHKRKIKSYRVETNFYQNWSCACTDKCRVPNYLGSYLEGKDQWIVMEDLDKQFPLRKQDLDVSEVQMCLRWLANFHSTFIHQKPIDLWEIGWFQA